MFDEEHPLHSGMDRLLPFEPVARRQPVANAETAPKILPHFVPQRVARTLGSIAGDAYAVWDDWQIELACEFAPGTYAPASGAQAQYVRHATALLRWALDWAGRQGPEAAASAQTLLAIIALGGGWISAAHAYLRSVDFPPPIPIPAMPEIVGIDTACGVDFTATARLSRQRPNVANRPRAPTSGGTRPLRYR